MAAPRAWRELSCPEVVERAQQCPGPQTPTHLPSPALPLLRSHGGPGRDPGGPVGGICALARTRTAQEKGRRRMKSWGSAHRGPGAANKPPDTGGWGGGGPWQQGFVTHPASVWWDPALPPGWCSRTLCMGGGGGSGSPLGPLWPGDIRTARLWPNLTATRDTSSVCPSSAFRAPCTAAPSRRCKPSPRGQHTNSQRRPSSSQKPPRGKCRALAKRPRCFPDPQGSLRWGDSPPGPTRGPRAAQLPPRRRAPLPVCRPACDHGGPGRTGHSEGLDLGADTQSLE